MSTRHKARSLNSYEDLNPPEKTNRTTATTTNCPTFHQHNICQVIEDPAPVLRSVSFPGQETQKQRGLSQIEKLYSSSEIRKIYQIILELNT
ncbi:hypothetical protein NPIL_634101 [Nephila pilipes]|uniref:Uncharacterized protein n=1 Tax=Nephila pilipes TaxID=299642 RepID=A0A8X6TL04_NEPPI|nr:hypothetical protein NPIL_634101 [Nephila pilipes]